MIRVLPRPKTTASGMEIPPKPIDWVKILTIISFLAPGIIMMMVILYVPVAQSIEYSQYRWNGLTELEEENHVEWDNFERLWYKDEYRSAQLFRDAFYNTRVIIGLSLVIQLPLAMALALLVGRGDFIGKKLFRTVFFVPYVFSDPITAILGTFALHPNSGVVNTVFSSIIPGFENQEWLGQEYALYAVFAVLTWKFFGVYMILYMAALQSVDKDLEDAARIDGANEFNVLRRITLPLMGPTIRMTIYLSVLGSLQQFVIIWIMTSGGPVGASEVVGTYLYKYGIDRWRLGFGSAVAVVMFGMSLIFSLGYQWMILRQDYRDAKA